MSCNPTPSPQFHLYISTWHSFEWHVGSYFILHAITWLLPFKYLTWTVLKCLCHRAGSIHYCLTWCMECCLLKRSGVSGDQCICYFMQDGNPWKQVQKVYLAEAIHLNGQLKSEDIVCIKWDISYKWLKLSTEMTCRKFFQYPISPEISLLRNQCTLTL